MQKYYYGTEKKRSILKHAYIINLNENTKPIPTIEYIVIGKEVEQKYQKMALSILTTCPLTEEPEHTFIDVYEDDQFICHLGNYGIVFDIDKKCVMMYGILNDEYRRSIIVHDLCKHLSIKPDAKTVQILLKGQHKRSNNEKLLDIIYEVISGLAVISAKTRQEVTTMEKRKICKAYTIPPGDQLDNHYFTLDRLGILHPVDIYKNNWDRIYTADSIIQLDKKRQDDYAVGFTDFKKQTGDFMHAQIY